MWMIYIHMSIYMDYIYKIIYIYIYLHYNTHIHLNHFLPPVFLMLLLPNFYISHCS